MATDSPEKLKRNRICHSCVGEPYLTATIFALNKIAKCSYCGKKAASISLGTMSKHVHQAFEKHYQRTASEPDAFEYAMMNDEDSTYSWEREGEPATYAIMNAAEIPESAAEDIRSILEEEYSDFEDIAAGDEAPYDSEAHYEEMPPTSGSWQIEWDRVERSLRTEARFFSHDAEKLLASVFKNIESLRTKAGNPVLTKAGPNTAHAYLYRARVFQSERRLAEALKNLDLELGSPPTELAMAGRMNARGISVFYGATNAHTALAEIRPPVGSRVVTGQFLVIREIQLLDLAALGEVQITGSIFDPKFGDELERATFLKILGEHMMRPVMPDDEALDYLVTQAVADFLATSATVPIDGIIYRSAQTPNGERNVVLFHKAARVERFERPSGTEVESSLGHWQEDGWETGYEVIESVPPADAKKPTDPLEALIQMADATLDGINTEVRPVTLRLEKGSLAIHEVEAVAFKSHESKVTHHRWEKREDSPF